MFKSKKIPISALPVLNPCDKVDVMDLNPRTRDFILKNEKENLWWTRKSDKPYVWEEKVFRSAKKGSRNARKSSTTIKEIVPSDFDFAFVKKQSFKKASTCRCIARPTSGIHIIPDTREVRTSYQTSRRKAISRSALIIPKSQQEIIREDIQNCILSDQERKELQIRPISAISLPKYQKEQNEEEEGEEVKIDGDDAEKVEIIQNNQTERPEKPFCPTLNISRNSSCRKSAILV